MEVRGVTDYDIVNYKEPAFFIAFPYCSFKCDKECGHKVCQNSSLANEPTKTVEINLLLEIYETNPLTHALVCGGLEPFDSKGSLYVLLNRFRRHSNDPIIIYTGYTEEELINEIPKIKSFGNIIIKFGRFIPNRPSRYDEILGVTLASDNQYAKYYE
jgi:hypothetical protein